MWVAFITSEHRRGTLTTLVHPTAFVEEGAVIRDGCQVGPFSIVHANVRLGANSIVGSHSVLGHTDPVAAEQRPLVIGDRAHIRSHTVLYGGSTFGERLTTGHRVTCREGTRAGAGLQLGTLTDCQGDIVIGEHVRTHSNVHLCRGATIGSFVWIFPYVVLTNDPHPPSDGFHEGPTIDDHAVIATMSVILPGVRIGSGALVGAHSLVNRDVPSGAVVAGAPAKVRGQASDVQLRDGSGPAYPWTRHFHRGYPTEVTDDW